MKSSKAITNRANAKRSTGPKSVAGKAIVAANATRHGLLSAKPVLVAGESAAKYDRHLRHTLECYSPQGYMETILAERVAQLLWRLNRVARHEADRSSLEIRRREKRLQHLKLTREDAIETSKLNRELLCDLNSLRIEPDTYHIDGDRITDLLDQLSEEAGIDLHADDFPKPVEIPDGTSWEDFPGWTVGMAKSVVNEIVNRSGISFESLAAAVDKEAKESERKGLKEGLEISQQLELEPDTDDRPLLPDAETLEKMARYETTLDRSLYRAIEELERIQAKRAGTAPPRTIVDAAE